MKRGTAILAITLLITLAVISGCMLNFGTTKLDFGSSDQAQKALACFCQTYGDPAAYNGPPRFIAPLVSTELKDNIPQDKVTRFSTDTRGIFFWVIYQNFGQGEDLHLTWIFQGKAVATITKKTDSWSGVAFGEFVRPDAGWPEGTHTIKIEGKGNTTEVTFTIRNAPTERKILDFSGEDGVSCPDLLSLVTMPPTEVTTTVPPTMSTTVLPVISTTVPPVISTTVTPWQADEKYWISGRSSNSLLTCHSPNNTLVFMGNTGPAVTRGTQVQLKLFNVPGSGIQDIPPEGILIGSANTKNDGGWEYSWNGHVPPENPVPYMLLRYNQEYMVKALLPDGVYTKMSFLYLCPVPTQYSWVSGGLSKTELSCDPPDNTLLFSGNTYVAPAGTPVQLRLLNAADSGTQDIPPEGILIGSTTVRNDGSYEYRWTGDVPGYRLRNGQEYFMQARFPDSGLSTGGRFRYACTGTGNDYWVSGRMVNPVFTCYPPDNHLQFMGTMGPAVPPGTPLELKIFNVPDSGNNDLPMEGVWIGPASIMNDRSWVFSWDGYVEGYGLIQNQDYMIKVLLPDGTSTKIDLPYQCLGTEAPNWWVSDNGRQVLSCSPPNNTVTFRGRTGSDVPPGTALILKLFHMPDAGTKEIFIDYMDVRSDGSYEYTWNGNIRGYTFQNGQEYTVKVVLPGGRYTKQNFLYQCPA